MTQFQLAQLARHNDFRARIEYLMVKAALAQLADSPTSADILLGQRILDGQETIHAWALGALTNATIAAGAHSESGDTITESDLEFAVNALWTAFGL